PTACCSTSACRTCAASTRWSRSAAPRPRRRSSCSSAPATRRPAAWSPSTARRTSSSRAARARPRSPARSATRSSARRTSPASALVEPFTLDGRTLVVTGHIGIAMPANADERPESLLQKADAALARARERGVDWEVLGEKAPAPVVRRVNRHVELERALQDGQLVLHYQPQLSLTRRTSVVSMEALVRWRDPERGLIPPEQFLPFAERTGLTTAIGP